MVMVMVMVLVMVMVMVMVVVKLLVVVIRVMQHLGPYRGPKCCMRDRRTVVVTGDGDVCSSNRDAALQNVCLNGKTRCQMERSHRCVTLIPLDDDAADKGRQNSPVFEIYGCHKSVNALVLRNSSSTSSSTAAAATA